MCVDVDYVVKLETFDTTVFFVSFSRKNNQHISFVCPVFCPTSKQNAIKGKPIHAQWETCNYYSSIFNDSR